MTKKTTAPPAALPAAERSETERSEGSRSAAAGKAGAAPAASPRPNPEVVAKPRRRTFTADYKRRILDEADTARFSGSVGALLRSEGLYSSHLVTWRRERDAGILAALSPHKRGRKSERHPLEDENQKLRRHNERLSEQLRKAEIIIDVQKKWLLCWDGRFRRRAPRRAPDAGRLRARRRRRGPPRLRGLARSARFLLSLAAAYGGGC